MARDWDRAFNGRTRRKDLVETCVVIKIRNLSDSEVKRRWLLFGCYLSCTSLKVVLVLVLGAAWEAGVR
jgi:hypothetical protein